MGRQAMGRQAIVTGFLASAALALVPQMAAAQQIRDLDREASNVRTFTGELQNGVALFEADVPAGSALRIDVIAIGDLDPTVSVTDAVTEDVLAEDDDGGEGLNSRVTIPGADGRRIRISVNAFGFEGSSEDNFEPQTFELKLTTLEHRPQNVREVSWGSAFGGTLLAGDKHEFSFTGEKGQLLEVALLASEDSNLDPYLELRDENGEVVASNDDGGGGLNALLRHVMESDQTYTITASAYSDSSGEYTLRVGERRELVVQAPVQMIGLGDTAEGRLGAGYENGDIDPASIDYQLSEAAIARIIAGNGEVTIHMDAAERDAAGLAGVSGGLDPFLELGFDTPLGFAVVESDDDGSGTGLNSMLPIDLSSIAESRELLSRLRIRAKSFSGTGGAYTLTITEGMEARAAYDGEDGVPVVEPAYD